MPRRTPLGRAFAAASSRPRHAGEYARVREQTVVRVSSGVDPEWWQLELREMRVGADGRVSYYGEAF